MSSNLIAKQSNLSFTLHNKLIEIIGYSKKSFIVIGRILSELKEDDNYKTAIGDMTWVDYLTQPEIGLSKGEAERLIQIYEEFIKRLGFEEDFISQIPIKNIHYLLPIIKKKDKEEVEPLIEDALHLSQKDFKDRVYEVKHEEDDRTYTYLIMKKCDQTSNMQRVHDISSEDIESFIKKYVQ